MPGNVNRPRNDPNGNPNNEGPDNTKQEVDIVFVQDATGSQRPYITAARTYAGQHATQIEKFLGGDMRYRVIPFHDHKEQERDKTLSPVDDFNPFTKDHKALETQLANIKVSGGGDGPEAQLDALDAALRSSWRKDALRLVVLITDSPPHGIGEPGDTVPPSHPRALTEKSIRKTFTGADTHLSVVGCEPTISRYKTAVKWYTDFAKDTGGDYIPLNADPSRDPGPMSRAVVGSVLQGADSLRLADKYRPWIMAKADRGHDALVDELHSHLSSEGEECHEVHCTDHSGHDVQYRVGPVSRARVDAIVRKTRTTEEYIEEDPLLRSVAAMMKKRH